MKTVIRLETAQKEAFRARKDATEQVEATHKKIVHAIDLEKNSIEDHETILKKNMENRTVGSSEIL